MFRCAMMNVYWVVPYAFLYVGMLIAAIAVASVLIVCLVSAAK
jgi:hypothetical protein